MLGDVADENLAENDNLLRGLGEPTRLGDIGELVPDDVAEPVSASDELLRTVAGWCMSERKELDSFINETLRVRQELADALGRDVSEIAVPALNINVEKAGKP